MCVCVCVCVCICIYIYNIYVYKIVSFITFYNVLQKKINSYFENMSWRKNSEFF